MRLKSLAFSISFILGLASYPVMAAGTTAAAPAASATSTAATNPTPEQPAEPMTVFRNVKVFNGRDPQLSEPMDVWIKGQLIEKIEPHNAQADTKEASKVVEGEGRVLMPGLIDGHTHALIGSLTLGQAAGSSDWMLGVVMKKTLEDMLQRGFTTIRDLGIGVDGSIAKAVDDGVIKGPRIFPSAMSISQTGGHGDVRPPYAANPTLDDAAVFRSVKRAAILVDGVPQVLTAVRENLKAGATQIKIHAGGGATSNYDPLFSTQFTLDELKAAVEAADNWGTYVVAHAYNDKSVKKLIESGVKQIAHGHLMSEEVVKLVAENNVIVQPDFVWLWASISFAQKQGVGALNLAKMESIQAEAPKFAELLKKYNVKVVFGSDLTGPAIPHQNKELTLRKQYWTSPEILIQATGNAFDAINMSGPLNKYGKFGVIEPGARADMLLVKGDPVQDVSVLEDYENNMLIIMKDGKIHKEAL